MNTFLIVGLVLVIALIVIYIKNKKSPHLTAEQKIIPNFMVIAPGVFRGANPVDHDRQGMPLLAKLHVKTDIDFQGGDVENIIKDAVYYTSEPGERAAVITKEGQEAQKFGINFLHLALDSHDGLTREEDKKVDTALELMRKATPENAVYIHCEHGADRTGLVAGMYRIKFQNWPIDKARAEWIAHGHSTESQLLFTGALNAYFDAKAKSFKDPAALEAYFNSQAG